MEEPDPQKRCFLAPTLRKGDVVLLPHPQTGVLTEITIAKVSYSDPVAGRIKFTGTDGGGWSVGGSQRVEVLRLNMN